MPQQTASGAPYVVPADAVADYPVHSLALATWLEAWRSKMPKAHWSGGVAVAVNNANSATAAVTFPPGLFTSTPIVTVSTSGTSVWVAMSSGASANGFTATARNVDGAAATATPSVNWHATQNA